MLLIENLSVEMGGRQLLNGISLDLKSGKCLCIIGESGSGKTTLLRAMQGLVPITNGQIHFNPSMDKEDPKQNRSLKFSTGNRLFGLPGVSWIMQNPLAALNPRQRIGQAIAESLHHARLDKKKERELVSQVLAEVELSADLANRYPAQLSLGQAQRACIARAIISRPRMILFDEPLSALDAVVQKQIARTIHAIQRTHGLTYIFVTHDLGFARTYADEVLVLKRGQVEAYQQVSDFFASPTSVYGAELIHAAETLGSLEPQRQTAGRARQKSEVLT